MRSPRRPAGLLRAGLLPAALLPVALLLAGCAGGLPPKPGAPPVDPNAPVGASEPASSANSAGSAAAAGGAGGAAGEDGAALMAELVKPFTCPTTSTPGVTTVVPVTDAPGLRTALGTARAGDVIQLGPGVYPGRFTASVKTEPARPIYLCGPSTAILDGGSVGKGYVLHLAGAQNWRLSGFTVRNGQKGVIVDRGRSNVLQSLVVTGIGDEGVHLRDRSTGNVVRGLTISGTGRHKPKFGEGIYVGSARSNWCDVDDYCQPDRSDGNQLLDNTISGTTAEAIDVKEGTSSGVIAGNAFDGGGLTAADSWVDVKGNYWTITDNHGRTSPTDGFQTHVILDGWGTGNVFRANTAALGSGTGVGYYLNQELTNRVSCDNIESGAAKGLSNVPCQG